jgi:hypothetical protein
MNLHLKLEKIFKIICPYNYHEKLSIESALLGAYYLVMKPRKVYYII